jgi:putative ABC transport system permease protein
MSNLRRVVHRLATLFRPDRAETDLAREIDAHLRLLEDQFVEKGLPRDEARHAARRAFGGVEQTKELQRDARSIRWLAGWPMDLKLGVRMLAKTPGLTVVGVIALAVAIGAGAAFLELTNDLLNPTLDVPGADRLVGVRAWDFERRVDQTWRLKDFAEWRTHAQLLEDLGAARSTNRHLTTPDGRIEPVRAVEISAAAFRLMPARPLLGRALSIDDEQPGAPPVAVIGHQIWTSRFNGHPQVVGTLARLGSTDYTVVGVMPEGFAFPVNQNLWIPLKNVEAVTQIFGRLKEGATAAAAQAELQALTGPQQGKVAVLVRPYVDSIVDEDRQSGEALAFRALNLVFVLLLGICAANVATLVFARTAMREAEITLRTAIGATRGRITAQLFAEALVLSVLAAFAGLSAARFIRLWAKSLWEQGIGPMPFWWDDGFSSSTVLYAFALAVLAALVVGVVPALKATGRRLQGAIRDVSSGTSTMKFGGIWTGVIATQAAMTVVFIAVIVALGWSSLRKHAGRDVVYPRDQLLTARAVVDRSNGEPAEWSARMPETLRAIAATLKKEPGVASVSYATALPGTIWEQMVFELQSPALQTFADAHKATEELWSSGAGVGENFFETVGIPLIAGRTFTAAEIRQNAPVAIVDETFVRTVLGGRSSVGIMLRRRPEAANQQPGPWMEIVGVVKDASNGVRNGPDDAVIYRPAAPAESMRLLVRTHGAASAMAQRVYAAAVTVHPDLRLADLKSVAQVAEDDALPERIFLRSFTVISAIALLLATAGIYALVSFTLARRTREIGIRAALGAAPLRIIGGVFSRAFIQIGLGVAAGAVPGFVIIQSIANDVGSMRLSLPAALGATAAVCAFVVAVALASCTVPLRRALRIDPIRALRSE